MKRNPVMAYYFQGKGDSVVSVYSLLVWVFFLSFFLFFVFFEGSLILCPRPDGPDRCWG